MWCAVIEKPGSARLEGTPAVDLGHMKVLLKWCICMLVVDLGIVIMCIIIIICFLCFVLFCVLNVCCAFFPLFLFFSHFFFLESIQTMMSQVERQSRPSSWQHFCLIFFCLFCRHTASAPITLKVRNAHRWKFSNREARKRPARRHSRNGPST